MDMEAAFEEKERENFKGGIERIDPKCSCYGCTREPGVCKGCEISNYGCDCTYASCGRKNKPGSPLCEMKDAPK